MLLGMRPDDPGAYGRLILGADGALESIVEARDDKPAGEQIWDHDREVLTDATAFYVTVAERTGKQRFTELAAAAHVEQF